MVSSKLISLCRHRSSSSKTSSLSLWYSSYAVGFSVGGDFNFTEQDDLYLQELVQEIQQYHIKAAHSKWREGECQRILEKNAWKWICLISWWRSTGMSPTLRSYCHGDNANYIPRSSTLSAFSAECSVWREPVEFDSVEKGIAAKAGCQPTSHIPRILDRVRWKRGRTCLAVVGSIAWCEMLSGWDCCNCETVFSCQVERNQDATGTFTTLSLSS